MIVNALVVDKPGAPFVHQEIQLDDGFRDGEVLVAVHATGVCRTDLNFRDEEIPGMFPAVLGHEGTFSTLIARPASSHCQTKQMEQAFSLT